jgi:hypothetical protein
MQTAGPYRLLDALGTCEVGDVWSGVDDAGRAVTVAVLNARASADERWRAAFAAASDALARAGEDPLPVVGADHQAPTPWVACGPERGPGAARIFTTLGQRAQPVPPGFPVAVGVPAPANPSGSPGAVGAGTTPHAGFGAGPRAPAPGSPAAPAPGRASAAPARGAQAGASPSDTAVIRTDPVPLVPQQGGAAPADARPDRPDDSAGAAATAGGSPWHSPPRPLAPRPDAPAIADTPSSPAHSSPAPSSPAPSSPAPSSPAPSSPAPSSPAPSSPAPSSPVPTNAPAEGDDGLAPFPREPGPGQEVFGAYPVALDGYRTGSDPYARAPDGYPIAPTSGYPVSAAPVSGEPLGPYRSRVFGQPGPAPAAPRRTGLLVALVALAALLVGAGAGVAVTAARGGRTVPRPAPTASLDPGLPSAAPSQPGVEPPQGGGWPARSPTFTSAEQTRPENNLDGVGFSFRVPPDWTCRRQAKTSGSVRYTCGTGSGPTLAGGDLVVRSCPAPCSEQRRAELRQAEEAWGLRWIKSGPFATWAETTRINGQRRYGLVYVAFWRSNPEGSIDREVVLRMTAPPARSDDLRKVVNSVRERTFTL